MGRTTHYVGDECKPPHPPLTASANPPRVTAHKGFARVYRAGWEAVCKACGACSGLYADEEKELAQDWAREHNRREHP